MNYKKRHIEDTLVNIEKGIRVKDIQQAGIISLPVPLSSEFLVYSYVHF